MHAFNSKSCDAQTVLKNSLRCYKNRSPWYVFVTYSLRGVYKAPQTKMCGGIFVLFSRQMGFQTVIFSRQMGFSVCHLFKTWNQDIRKSFKKLCIRWSFMEYPPLEYSLLFRQCFHWGSVSGGGGNFVPSCSVFIKKSRWRSGSGGGWLKTLVSFL